MLKIYLLEQSTVIGYDTYDSCVVAANNPMEARLIHPSNKAWDGKEEHWGCWAAASDVTVILLGFATSKIEPGVICASFNAG